MRTLANRIDLGVTRIAGYTLYEETSKEFLETTPREVKELVKKNQVNGLKLVNSELELDNEGFNIRNLMVKSAVGKYRTLYSADTLVNAMYAVVRVIYTDNGRLYEVINNRCGRVKVVEDKIKMLYAMGYVAGVRIVHDGEIEICKGVTIEYKRTIEGQSIADTSNIDIKQSLTDVDIKEKAEDIGKDGNNAEVKKADSLETIFESLDTTKLNLDANIEASVNNVTTATTENKEEVSPLKEPNEKMNVVTTQKVKKNK